MKTNLYEEITSQILSQIESTGELPWKKPWFGSTSLAVSHINGNRYSFLNQIMLIIQAKNNGVTTPYEYLTFKQVNAEGGCVKKGEKGSRVYFYKIQEYEKKDSKTGEIIVDKVTGKPVMYQVPILKSYSVFEVSQCEGIKRKYNGITLFKNDKIDSAEKLVDSYISRENIKLVSEKVSDEAYYSPSKDMINIPTLSQYKDVNEYYSTLFHEMVHSTGHPSRLNRIEIKNKAAFGSEEYSKEELIAEIGSSFLRGLLGIEDDGDRINSIAYINAWCKTLKNDSRMIVNASRKAEAACKYITEGNVEIA